jgi:hypothetical protein
MRENGGRHRIETRVPALVFSGRRLMGTVGSWGEAPMDSIMPRTMFRDAARFLTLVLALPGATTALAGGEALRPAGSTPGVECQLVSSDGIATSGDDKKVGDKVPWDDAFELIVDFEIKPPEGKVGRYRRPYVAIWVEDADGLSVRTLMLWLQNKAPGPRWIPDLKRWYQADQVRQLVDKTDLVETTSRATRPAGKYKVIWDGKDDRGKPVNQGKYTLSIEVAREHGTYQIIRQELTLGDMPIAETLKGNAEIKAASLDYRRKDEDAAR